MPRQDVMTRQVTAAALAIGTERPAKRPRLKRPLRPAAACMPRPTRLSEHAMWTSSQRYYVSRGLAAFTSGEVPHEISTSRFLGTGLAALVLAFWADADARRRAEEGGGAEAG